MKELACVKEKIHRPYIFLLMFTLLGCEVMRQDDSRSVAQEYIQLDQANPKDKRFYEAIEKSLKNRGSLLYVHADAQELNLYREGKRPYPTNYRYTLKANPSISLEEIKDANIALN
jgi:hypothetical protein